MTNFLTLQLPNLATIAWTSAIAIVADLIMVLTCFQRYNKLKMSVLWNVRKLNKFITWLPQRVYLFIVRDLSQDTFNATSLYMRFSELLIFLC